MLKGNNEKTGCHKRTDICGNCGRCGADIFYRGIDIRVFYGRKNRGRGLGFYLINYYPYAGRYPEN